LLNLPEFSSENSGKTVSMGYADKTRLGKRSGVIGQSVGAQAGENTERKVEAANEGHCWKTHETGWNAEIRDKPERSGSKRGCNAGDQGIELSLSKAVEKEVGDNKIIAACKRKSQGIGVMKTQASFGVGSCRFRALAKQSKHSDARVDRISPKVRIMREQLAKKAAVSIA